MADTNPLIHQVRLLTADLEPGNYLVSDETIEGYLGIYGSLPDPRLLLWNASADILDSMAVSEVLLAKKITTQDLSTDGPATAAALQKLSAGLRARAKALEDELGVSSFFGVVPLDDTTRLEAEEYRW